jgi:flavin-dependent dehydrogenase
MTRGCSAAEANSSAPIVISGAGPAGLAASLTISAAGRRAVIYERHEDVGWRFQGDFQGIENWSTDGDVLEELSSIGIESSFEFMPYREGTIFDPVGREYRYRSAKPLFYLVRRGPLEGTVDSALKLQALRAGVEIRFGEPKDELPEGGVLAHGPKSADAIAVGYLFETDMADGVFGALSDDLAPKGYSYLLTHRGRGTVASCLFDDFHQNRLHLERTVNFFRRHAGLRMREPRFFGGVGSITYPAKARAHGALFAGEAAGFQDALWGFGMRYAMLSGHLAAKALIEGRPGEYDRSWKRELGGFLRTGFVNRFSYARLGDRGYTRFLKGLKSIPDARESLHRLYRESLSKTFLFPVIRAALRLDRRPSAANFEFS